jgi:hypothetical protein
MSQLLLKADVSTMSWSGREGPKPEAVRLLHKKQFNADPGAALLESERRIFG